MVNSMANIEWNMENANDTEYPPEATVGDQRLRTMPRETTCEPALPWPSPAELHRHISRLAYEFYVRRGRLSGHELDDWLAAERIVLSRLTQSDNRTGDSPHAKKTK
jgi:hypothetical protein